jgi:hypothetical protein
MRQSIQDFRTILLLFNFHFISYSALVMDGTSTMLVGSNGGVIMFIDDSTGNVNIGSSNSQSSKLYVAGDVDFTGILRQGGVPYIGSQWSNNANNVFLLSSNVGIGTSTPSRTLDVNGSITALGYCNLVIDSFTSASTSNPPTASALSNVYSRSVFGSNTAVSACNAAIFGPILQLQAAMIFTHRLSLDLTLLSQGAMLQSLDPIPQSLDAMQRYSHPIWPSTTATYRSLDPILLSLDAMLQSLDLILLSLGAMLRYLDPMLQFGRAIFLEQMSRFRVMSLYRVT